MLSFIYNNIKKKTFGYKWMIVIKIKLGHIIIIK